MSMQSTVSWPCCTTCTLRPVKLCARLARLTTSTDLLKSMKGKDSTVTAVPVMELINSEVMSW